MSAQKNCFHLNTMAGGDGRGFWHHIYIHYGIHYKRPLQSFTEQLLGMRMPFKWRKRSLEERRKRVYSKLSPQRIIDQLQHLNQDEPMDVVGLCEVLRSQQPLYVQALRTMGFKTIHTALGHKAKGVKEHLSVILATRETSEAVAIPHPFPWAKKIGGGGGAVMARGSESGTTYFYVHLCTTEKLTLYQHHLKTLNHNMLSVPSEAPLILMGDFNVPLHRLQHEVPSLQNFTDCMNQPKAPTFLQWWDRRSVDHILARGCYPQPEQGRVIATTFQSDHAAVSSRLVAAN
ncbi:Endonuclease/exonuclease/phosphatase [Magnetococcus marinus MC-1]|uniref:Endonuclease/exonuclease/phosphatase n=1 Tax=Magnetococcus marinus (strain ATCC BAA-1437 / JCM 17883 / MC-1) TaxID=156889 RepID=A0LA00_MAGMM|nr:endonuclease/exonuclease/phosphatase family protein [Magnetococcus marinus]ABK44793.1 Endonuclease/exonuclease/phosphatase [Magnetococcus marinus MC-1]